MSNTIQIKRGNFNTLNTNTLAPYELGCITAIGDISYDTPFLIIGRDTSTSSSGYSSLWVDKATWADGTKSIIGPNNTVISVGSKTSPIYLEDGKFKTCSGTTISGTIEKADMLTNSRSIGVSLSDSEYANFNGQQDIVTGVTGTLPISKGGTGATTAQGAREKLGITLANLGAAPAEHSHNYIPITGGTINLGGQVTNSIAWGLTLSTVASGTVQNPPINFGSGIKFHVYAGENNEVRWSSIEGYAADVWANQTGIRFRTHSSGGNEYVATFAEGVMKIGDNTVIHTGNHFTQITQIARDKNISSTNSFEINDVSGYTAFVFIGYTAGSDATDGWNTITAPKDFIIGSYGQTTARTRRFVMGNASDSKTFTVNIDTNGKMTVTGGSAIGSGIQEGTFYVYGIK